MVSCLIPIPDYVWVNSYCSVLKNARYVRYFHLDERRKDLYNLSGHKIIRYHWTAPTGQVGISEIVMERFNPQADADDLIYCWNRSDWTYKLLEVEFIP